MGCPDLLVMFMQSMHKMMNTAVAEAWRKNVELLGFLKRASALKTLLAQYV